MVENRIAPAVFEGKPTRRRRRATERPPMRLKDSWQPISQENQGLDLKNIHAYKVEEEEEGVKTLQKNKKE